MNPTNLSNTQMDVLKEIGNIGAGNATTSMSELIDKKVDMKTPSVNIVTFDEMMEIIGGPENVIVAIYFKINGEAPGTVYFIQTIEKAEALVRQIVKDDELNLLNDEPSSPLAISALMEVGNIMIGSYLSALSDFLKLNMQPSVPHLSVDMAGAVLTAGIVEVSEVSDYAIVINTEFNDTKDEGIYGHFFLLPEPEALPKIFKSLGIKENE